MDYWLRAHLAQAELIDHWEGRARRLSEKWGWPQGWFAEFKEYLTDPRLTQEEFWVTYTLERMVAQDRIEAVKSKDDALAFYQDCPYSLWRQVVHRRHATWRTVLVTMRLPRGVLVEFGGGIGSVIRYVQRRKRDWRFVLMDVPSAHWDYGLWRTRSTDHIEISPDVITAFDVLEHLNDPLSDIQGLVAHLKFGGYLHWNFVAHESRHDLDLATPEQRQETIHFLRADLRTIWERPGHVVSQK